ncbi:unnamed protein product [Prorocentrum cordatum]|uniref:Heterokaryon incompatibility domain-containing protein n=1 Tax=Prorocentrum cordatum TaxID=2364126 RepID=A0ABN9PRQ1_9DINO|nr:unnamed protein product [Polarella glacialis]
MCVAPPTTTTESATSSATSVSSAAPEIAAAASTSSSTIGETATTSTASRTAVNTEMTAGPTTSASVDDTEVSRGSFTSRSSTTTSKPQVLEQEQGLDASTIPVVIIMSVCFACGTTCALVCWFRRRPVSRDQGHVNDGLLAVSVEETISSIPESMEFWLLPVQKIMEMSPDTPLPRHQVCRDMGMLVKRRMHIDDVWSGQYSVDMAAVSHRWPVPEHFDPECMKLRKLQDILKDKPSIQFLWIDWVCAPQWHGGGRSDEEEAEFRMILENILPYIFLGCRVIVLYERIYNQRFWPNVECWISTKMATEHGLVPASEDRLRVLVYGIYSASGKDAESMAQVLEFWHETDTPEAIATLSHDDILVTNAKDKEINLKVIASLDEQIQHRFAGHRDQSEEKCVDGQSNLAPLHPGSQVV